MKKNGFTLTELIIVILILGVLALIAIAYFRGQIGKGNDAKRKSDINRISIALEEYEKDHNCYPLPQLVTCSPGTGLQPYLDKIPCDPVTKASYYYDYQNAVCPGWYRLFTSLQNKTDSSLIPSIGPNGAYNFYQGSGNSPAVTSVTPTQSAAPGGSAGGTPGGASGFYGCKSGVCVPISWDSTRPGPECDPNYQNSSCYGQCGPQSGECKAWH